MLLIDGHRGASKKLSFFRANERVVDAEGVTLKGSSDNRSRCREEMIEIANVAKQFEIINTI
jgi:hypothetical protein